MNRWTITKSCQRNILLSSWSPIQFEKPIIRLKVNILVIGKSRRFNYLNDWFRRVLYATQAGQKDSIYFDDVNGVRENWKNKKNWTPRFVFRACTRETCHNIFMRRQPVGKTTSYKFLGRGYPTGHVTEICPLFWKYLFGPASFSSFPGIYVSDGLQLDETMNWGENFSCNILHKR